MIRIAFAALFALSAAAFASDGDKTTAISTGCPNCRLAGVDLSNECLKGADFRGANLDNAKLVLTCLSHAKLNNASFRHVDFSGANLGWTEMDGADLTYAVFTITSLKGADLSGAKGLTQAQLDLACGDAATKLPAGIHVKACQ